MQVLKAVFARFWAVWAIIAFVVTMLIFLIPIILFALPAKEPVSTRRFLNIARVWMGIFLPLVGCPLTVRGRENFAPGQQYIVICNHNSLMDIPISSPSIPGGNKTIAKVEFTKVPLFGLIYKLGSVLVDRKSDKSRKESFAKMKKVLDDGMHMCIYPEGTRNKTSEPIKAFHDGAFRLSIDTQRAIIPGIIFFTRYVNPAEEKFYLLPHRLLIEFQAPIAPLPGETVEALKDRCWQIMYNRIAAGA
ncbi:MAG TPA: 1-acyl-sn-glycerol-3-phosphate acyltransferase [Flavihumibacter sp.]|nr:1-acyl-sn-glycerol-3-phosphate acyltransferase [Bacteroidota bacterium]HPZ88393.1 1-acyl-sn-glycerol-3-phosphate acyltransferase [Flavihumibacter sp.]HQD09694.1 1-acyl-sn-glycerol-3-phosphate acyltransferase [Flavihumibacter sp.]